MTHDKETVERVARAIFPAMIKSATKFATDCPPDWVDGGNSFAQDEARSAAIRALSAMPPQEVSVQEAVKMLFACDELSQIGRFSQILWPEEGGTLIEVRTALRALAEWGE